MNNITRTITIVALVTATSAAFAGRGPEVRFNTAPAEQVVAEGKSYSPSINKHGGSNGNRPVGAGWKRTRVADSAKQTAKWNVQLGQ